MLHHLLVGSLWVTIINVYNDILANVNHHCSPHFGIVCCMENVMVVRLCTLLWYTFHNLGLVTTLAMLNIEPPEPKTSGSNADDPINLAHLLGMLHIVDLIC
jgi:hypothetical protein